MKKRRVIFFLSFVFFLFLVVARVYIYFIGQATYCGRQVFVVVVAAAVAIAIQYVCMSAAFLFYYKVYTM